MTMFFISIEIIGICVILFTLGLLIMGQDSKEQKLMTFFMCGALIQNSGYLLELMAPTLEAAVTAAKIQYIGSIFVPPLYCWFIYYYCYEKVPIRFLRVLAVIDLILLAVIFTCDHHQLYYRSLEWLSTKDGHHYMHIEYGPVHLIFMIFGCAVPYAMSFYALVRATITKPQQAASRKYKLMILLSTLPVLALLSYVLKLTYVFDLTPSAVGIVLAMVVILVWSRRIYDFRSLASEVVLNNMADGVIALDDQKRIVSYNQAAACIFPELGPHSIGENVSFLPNFPEVILEEDEQREFRIQDRFYESHVKKISEKNIANQGYVILVLDVTETRKHIELIKHVQEEAERANMAKSEFLANMSHEIRTPMNAIVGLSDIIMEESRGRKVYSYANDIKTASHNLLAIINDILDLSKVEAGKMELVLTNYYLKNVVGNLTSIMNINASLNGLVMKYEYDENLPCQYCGDEGRIRQILINLLSNAVKFTKKGYVKLSVSGSPGEDGMENLVFRVEDTGCGIRQEDLKIIFDDFKQADSRRNRSVEGTGLGLSITKHLVELMQGSIEVESVYGEGTVFTVRIPQKIVDSRTLKEMPDVPDTQEAQEQFRPFKVNRPYEILVVDDNMVNRRVAVGFLKHYGFQLTEAASGQEAIDLVRRNRYDIIFMDHMMPEMDGVEAVRIIRQDCGENGTSPTIIALTANAMEGVREMFLKNGFQDFLAKPLYRKPLNELLSKWIPEADREYLEETPEEKRIGGKLDFSDIHINGIDISEAMIHHSGEVSDYLELLQLYCTDGRRKITLLQELFEKEDFQTYEVEVHGLKSASANMGAMELSALAKDHEFAAKDGNAEYIRLHFRELITAYENQIRHIQDYLDRNVGGPRETSSGDRPGIEGDALLHEIQEALTLLETFHAKESAAKIESIRRRRLEPDVDASLKEIREQLRLYEDDAAEEMLRKLIDRLKKET